MARDRHGAAYEKTIRQMGADGWMGVGWPTEYGGRGLGEVEQPIFANEAQRADVHLPAVTLQTVGSDAAGARDTERRRSSSSPDPGRRRALRDRLHRARRRHRPRVAADDRAVRDGDHYVVNGQKIFTTGGHQADYVWLAVRTDPDAPKHQGISILIVDTTDPGYSWTPIITVDGAHHTNATYYSDVRVPVDMLVGEENARLEADHHAAQPRAGDARSGRTARGTARPRARTGPTRSACATCPTCRRALGEVTAIFRVNELLNWEVARAAELGEISVADASSSKVFASERGADARSRAGRRRRAARRPVRPGDGRADRLPRRAGQAQPRAHLRRRGQRGAARADRDVRARVCRGCPADEPAMRRIDRTTRSWPASTELIAVGETVRERRSTRSTCR